ncbi:uncharacterized protein LOC132549415, partial [Ylistrum balloti]|uniref:uncharacterized protein LOC132549415 n=1 Tax=Ylistrum balloti TaxID=509963 RepID=UPI0029059F07
MGPKQRTRNNSRSTPYDLSMPENWTTAKLKQELSKLGVTVSSSSKKNTLVALYKRHATNNRTGAIGHDHSPVTETDDQTPGRIRNSTSQNAPRDINNQDGVLSVISKFTDTISAQLADSLSNIRQEMQTIQDRIHSMESRPIPAAAAGSSVQTARDANVQQVIQGQHHFTNREGSSSDMYLTNDHQVGSRFTLQTAIAAHSSQTSEISPIQPNMGTHSFVRTQHGYSAESLPFVEVLSPTLRRHIVEDDKVSQTSTMGGSTANAMSFGIKPTYTRRDQINQLWDYAVSPLTKRTYAVAIQHLLRFTALCGLMGSASQLPSLSEDILIDFVSYCHFSLGLRVATIKLYLSGIRFHYLKSGLSNPLLQSERLVCILRGIKKCQSGLLNQKRFPITFDILKRMCNLLQGSLFSPDLDLLLLCACQMAFFGFLRCGEFTANHYTSNKDILRIKDIIMSSDFSGYFIILRSSKTDPFRQGVKISIFKNNLHLVCPVKSMYKYLQTRQSRGATGDAPLFVEPNNSVLTRDHFITYLRHILSVLGIDSSKYCGHSFRSGYYCCIGRGRRSFNTDF